MRAAYTRRIEPTRGDSTDLLMHFDGLLEEIGLHHERQRRDAELKLVEIMVADPYRTARIAKSIGLSTDLIASDDLRLIANCVRIKAMDRWLIATSNRAQDSLSHLIDVALRHNGHASHDVVRRPYGASVWSDSTIDQLMRSELWSEPWITSAVQNLQRIIDEQREQTTSLLRIRLSLMGAQRTVSAQTKAVAA